MLEAIDRALIVTDAQGRVTMWNAAAESLLGWTEAEVVGRQAIELLISEGDAGESERTLARVLKGEHMATTRWLRRRDGSNIRVQTASRPVRGSEGEVVAVVAIAEDITEQRYHELQERELTERLVLALDAGGLGTWRWDRASGAVTWDERLEALFGLQPGEFPRTFDAYAELLHPDDRDSVLATVADAVERKSSYRLEHRVIWPDGSVHWLVGAGLATCNEENEVTGTIGCVMDVTDRVEARLNSERAAELALAVADRERANRERLEFLNQMNEALGSADDTRQVMVNAVQAAVPRLGDWCAIHVLPEDGDRQPDVEIAHSDPSMVARAAKLRERFPYDPDALLGVPHAIRTGQAELLTRIDDELLDRYDVPQEVSDAIRELELSSSIVVPLIKRGRTLGALQFVRAGAGRHYGDEDVALARAVAGRVAASIANRRFAQHERLIATTLQASLLPSSLPDIDGLDLAVRYWAAGEGTQVGGDFYDVFPADNGRWAAVIGDVCGTGPSAAALTGLARHSIRMCAWNENSPDETLHLLNRAVRESRTDSFLTALVSYLEPVERGFEVDIASGGHPRPVLVRASGDTEVLATSGTLLGAFDTVRCKPLRTRLDPGDTLVFYTDGITDLPTPHHLDQDQLAALVGRATAGASDAEEIADGIRAGIEEVLPLSERDDDIALLVVKVLP